MGHSCPVNTSSVTRNVCQSVCVCVCVHAYFKDSCANSRNSTHLDVLVAFGLRDLMRKVGLLFEPGMSVIQLSGMCPLDTIIIMNTCCRFLIILTRYISCVDHLLVSWYLLCFAAAAVWQKD